MKFSVAIILGLTTVIGIANADVSHLARNQQAGHNAYNGRVVKQSFNSNGGTAFSASNQAYTGNNQNSKRYWWMNTDETQPQHTKRSHENSAAATASNGCNRCAAASNTLHLNRHNTQSQQQYQQPIIGKYITRRPNNINNNQIQYTQQKPAPIAGSPRDVNNYFAPQNSFQRLTQPAACTDSSSACVAPKFCLNGIIDQSAVSKARSSNGRCNAGEVCCRFARKSANFKVFALGDSFASPASTSEVLTNEGYVVNKPNREYLPSNPDRNPAPSNDDVITVRPDRPPTPPRPIVTRPPVPFVPAPIVIPVGCSAAMNCTRIEMCSAMGVISKTPVILTPEQQLFRVPLTECLHPQTKEQGFCCRDPDYVDPWPTGITGQYVPEELNKVFDNGQYTPDTTNQKEVIVKPDGYVIPQPSNTQNRLYLPPRNNLL